MEPTTISNTVEDTEEIEKTMGYQSRTNRGLDAACNACRNGLESNIKGLSRGDEELALWGFLYEVTEQMGFKEPSSIVEFIEIAVELSNDWAGRKSPEPPAA